MTCTMYKSRCMRWCSIISLLLLILIGSGCAQPAGLPYASGTQVQLSEGNFRVVRSNAVGQSSGFRLLGFIPITSATYEAALSDLYARAGSPEGLPQVLVNVTQEKTYPYFVLFSLPTLTIRADIIEFEEE